MNATDLVEYAAIAAVALNDAAQIITIISPTPDPATPLGKAYRIIEILAGLFGRAKDSGTNPPAT